MEARGVVELEERIAFMEADHEKEVEALKDKIKKLEEKLQRAGQMIGELKKGHRGMAQPG